MNLLEEVLQLAQWDTEYFENYDPFAYPDEFLQLKALILFLSRKRYDMKENKELISKIKNFISRLFTTTNGHYCSKKNNTKNN